MDNIEKKPKRPRIGEVRANPENSGANYERVNFTRPDNDGANAEAGADNAQRQYQPRQYQQRPYQRPYNNNRQGGYNNGYNRHNNQGGGYQRPYQQRQFNNAEGVESEGDVMTEGNNQNQSYSPRFNNGGYNRQGGYNNNRQGGYNQQRRNNYNNRGGYNNDGQQGGYNRQGGGYNNNRQGGYNNRQGGYNNNRQGGYNNRQGNFNNRKNNRNNNGFATKGKSFTPRPKQIEYEMPIPDPNEQIRLNKFMASAGICSRREADEFIQQGLVKVNGVAVTELGTKITHSDVVEYDDKVVALEKKCYIMLNKPKDCVTTSDDPNGRLTVMDLVKGACKERIYPVGRLDRNTTGVLLLTNDGDLASKLTHPQYVKKKIYHVWTDKDISEEDMQHIADGIELEDGEIHADAISYATDTDRNQAGIEIHSGRNRIVRRIFESLGYHVTKLDRVYFAGLTKKNLPRGRWRYLTQEEVNYLKMGSFE
jgi:23S rRNA pseudouridine2605 synthase